MTRRSIQVTLVTFVLLAAIVIGAACYCIFAPNTREATILLPPGATVSQLVDSLRRHDAIKNTGTLHLVARLKRYTGKTPAGKYLVRQGMNNNELINMFRSGQQAPVSFTFNNIRTVEQLAEVAARHFNFTAEELLSATRDTALLRELGCTPPTLPAIFIPNTYQIYWNTSPANFLRRMKREYDAFWNADRLRLAEAANLTPVQVITLASIVEEETARADEYPIIAGVYMNRLRRGMKLDACPTIKYVLGDFTITRVLDRYTRIESPYNTYLHAGLPPGPIRVTSPQVIDAVLHYQHHDYLYFCARADFSGRHHFSRTLRQHNAYAREYHRELNRRRVWE